MIQSTQRPDGRPAGEVSDPAAPQTLQIGGTDYTVTTYEPGVCYRLEKQARETAIYDVALVEGRIRCDCPAFMYRHDEARTTCKHGLALVAAGLLPAPW